MSNIIYLTDRSRIDTREECGQKRYLNYDMDVDGEPIGIQRKTASLPLLDGSELHETHARLLAHHAGLPGYENETLDAIVNAMRARFAEIVEKRGVHGEDNLPALVREQTALLEALLRAFEREWIPRILADYDVVSIEKPMDWEMHPGLVQKLRFDVVLRRKGDGQLIILDYKSMKYQSDTFDKKLERSTQTSLYITAAEELFGEPVEMAYLGIVKGAWKKDTAKSSPYYGEKIQQTPFLYSWALKGNLGIVWSPEYTQKKGFVRTRVYEHISVKEWIDYLWNNHKSILTESFVWTPPFAPTPQQRAERVELIVREELEYIENIRRYEAMRREAVATGNEVLLAKAEKFLRLVAAPKRDNACFKYGEEAACQFYEVCWNEGARDYVLEDGAFEPRVPHHSTELEEAA